MFKKEFASSYTSFDSTGATYITKHTNIKLVGIDYLSIGCLEDIVKTHQILLGQVCCCKRIHLWGLWLLPTSSVCNVSHCYTSWAPASSCQQLPAGTTVTMVLT